MILIEITGPEKIKTHFWSALCSAACNMSVMEGRPFHPVQT